jgi:hypothetical protein
MRLAFLLPLAALVFFTGCAGYKIGPIQPTIMAGIHTIAVPSFKNDTLEPRIEVLLANAVIKQIQQDGTYQVANESNADAILKGTLIEIRRHPARSVRGNVLQTKEFTLELKCRYEIVNRTTGVILYQSGVSGTTSFFVSGSDSGAADVNQDERQAIPLAAEDLAVQVVSQISEGW